MAASYSIQDFAGNGVLKDLVDKLEADGWDDVPTLKMINAADMEALQLTDEQRVCILLSFPGVLSELVLAWVLRVAWEVSAARHLMFCPCERKISREMILEPTDNLKVSGLGWSLCLHEV